MKHVSEIIKQHDTALIIGSGHSAAEFDYTYIKDVDVWSINWTDCPVHIDFLVYYDVQRKKYFDKYGNPEHTAIVAFEKNASANTDYYYTTNDIIFIDSGAHALQICSNILKYHKIYLIGYDYYTDSDKLRRVDSEPANEKEKADYQHVIFERALHRYEYPTCKHVDLSKCTCKKVNIWQCQNIYNLNKRSRLHLFPKKEF